MSKHPHTPSLGLARTLSKLGYCSRSKAVELIRTGRVIVNGKLIRNPEIVVSGERDQIAINGKAVEPSKKIYLMLNKPRGVITTASDEKGRETIYGLLNSGSRALNLGDEAVSWIAPVGRLDKASEGLLLLTNNSEWGSRIAAPETHLNKTYHVQIATVADERLIRNLTNGVKTKDGVILRVKLARQLRAGEKNCWLEIVLDEGKNRQIRRMMEHLGIEVLRLIRVAIGPLQLGELAKGEHRQLTPKEKRMLDRALREKI